MKNELDHDIRQDIGSLIYNNKININKYFRDGKMFLESIPSTIHELMTVLPKILETRVGTFYLSMTHDMLEGETLWYACYRDFEGTIYEIQESHELFDALGKLLVLIIKEGWLG
jgi:hypothetical protein